MIAIEFGNLCFNVTSSEQSILMVISPKNIFSSLDEFITEAFVFWNQIVGFIVIGLRCIKILRIHQRLMMI